MHCVMILAFAVWRFRCDALWSNCTLERTPQAQPPPPDIDGELIVMGYPKSGEIPMLNRKVIKGSRVTIMEHPYIASIRRQMAHYLTGALVGANLVITAAHPLVDVPVVELSVVVSQNYNDRGSLVYTVIMVVFNPQYNPSTLYADIALLRVYEYMPYRFTIKPVRRILDDTFVINGSISAFVTGWGRCDVSYCKRCKFQQCDDVCLPRATKYYPNEFVDPMLKSINIYVSERTISCSHYTDLDISVSAGTLCAGQPRTEEPATPCLGVPGAPLVVQGKLLGVLSWGFGCAFEKDLPLVFTDIRYHYTWVQSTINILRSIPPSSYWHVFETTRATILHEWLAMTRVEVMVHTSHFKLEFQMWDIDKALCDMPGNVYDIRDYYAKHEYRAEKKKRCENLKRKLQETALPINKNFTETTEMTDDSNDKQFQPEQSDEDLSGDDYNYDYGDGIGQEQSDDYHDHYYQEDTTLSENADHEHDRRT